MYAKTFVALSLSAMVLATPEQEVKREDSELSSLAALVGVTSIPTAGAALSSIEASLEAEYSALLPDESILSVLETAVPSSLLSELENNAAYASSWASEIEAGSTPSWVAALPTNVKSYLESYATELEAAATSDISAAGSNVASLTSAAGSVLASAASAASSLVASAASDGSASATSDSGAAPTKVMAASFAGAVGILGLALAL
ncbi:MAG: hypothetical protein M1834_009041 [Cirrosporium novae-zelandiae]|nr:MAG: hypothetical protein M1834_009041 [Cirrosporium novae-zelandiae]